MQYGQYGNISQDINVFKQNVYEINLYAPCDAHIMRHIPSTRPHGLKFWRDQCAMLVGVRIWRRTRGIDYIVTGVPFQTHDPPLMPPLRWYIAACVHYVIKREIYWSLLFKFCNI